MEVRANLTPTQLTVLIGVLQSPGGVAEADLARALALPLAPVRSIVETLAGRRFVSITPSPRAADAVVDGTVNIHEEPWVDLVELERRIDAAVENEPADLVQAAAEVLERVSTEIQSDSTGEAVGTEEANS